MRRRAAVGSDVPLGDPDVASFIVISTVTTIVVLPAVLTYWV